MNKTMDLKKVFFPSKFDEINNRLLIPQKIRIFSNNNNEKIKDYLYLKQKILHKKKTSRNENNLMKLQSFSKSTNDKIASKPQINLLSLYQKNVEKKQKGINSYFFKSKKDKTIKRNCSAYYIGGDLHLTKLYIGDLLLNDQKGPNKKRTKIFDIEKRINDLEKSLNLSNIIPKNKTFNIKKSLMKKIKIKRTKEEKKNHMPDYLKEELHIKGTNIISPFCKKWRDQYMIKKFDNFFNKNEDSLKNSKKLLIDNKLNLLYAENQKMYQTKLKLMNKKLKEQGKQEKCRFLYSPSEKQLKDMAKKVGFMKDVFYFAYPNQSMTLSKSVDKKGDVKNKETQTNLKIREDMNKSSDKLTRKNIYEIKFQYNNNN